MKHLFLFFTLIFSLQAFSQTSNSNKVQEPKTDSTLSTDNGLPVGIGSSTQVVKVKRKPSKVQGYIAPAASTVDSNCAGHLGKGDSGYTACEAGKGTR